MLRLRDSRAARPNTVHLTIRKRAGSGRLREHHQPLAEEAARGDDDTPRARGGRRGADAAVEALGRVLDPADVAAVVAACGARERRRRKLPAGLVVVLCVAMNWYAADPLPEVFRRLVAG